MNANPENGNSEEPAAPLFEQLRQAAAFLTRFPLQGSGADADEDDVLPPGALTQSMWLFPLVGFGIGLAGALLLGILIWLNLPAPVAATLALGAIVWLTGALHEDGLGDVADGFGGGSDKLGKLAIMRDSRLGTYGTLTLTAIFIAKVAALATLATVSVEAAGTALVAAAAWSRALLAPTMRWLPPAREDGLGRLAGMPSETNSWKGLALGALLATFVLISPAGIGFVAILAAGGLAAFAVGWLALRQIGGYTGDVLGAAQQAAETAVLVIASAVIVGG